MHSESPSVCPFENARPCHEFYVCTSVVDRYSRAVACYSTTEDTVPCLPFCGYLFCSFCWCGLMPKFTILLLLVYSFVDSPVYFLNGRFVCRLYSSCNSLQGIYNDSNNGTFHRFSLTLLSLNEDSLKVRSYEKFTTLEVYICVARITFGLFYFNATSIKRQPLS
jgi:hypothetical protein